MSTLVPGRNRTTAAERAVLAAVDLDRLVALTSRLVAVPSVSADESPGQRLVAALLDGAGADVQVTEHDVTALSSHPAYSAEFDRDELIGVVGRVGSGDGPTLLVDGHVDVVPPGRATDWTSPAFTPTVRDGALYGRGACDMKGGLAATIHALEAIRAAGVELTGTAVVASVGAEEDGGAGTLALLDNELRADACLIPEPTGLAVVPAVAGALSWRITLRGLSAHGALREEGVSAIEKLPVVLAAVQALERRRNRDHADPLFDWLQHPFAICGGRVVGGDWPSSEADWLTWEGRYGVAPGEDLDEAREQFERAVAGATTDDPWLAEHPPKVTWWGGQFLPARTDLDDPIVTTTTAAVSAVTDTADVDVRGMPYGCDMGLTVGLAHIPTVVFGPGDIRAAHRPDEHVSLADLAVASGVIAVTMMRTCGVDR